MKAPSERRVAIVLANYPNRDGRIGRLLRSYARAFYDLHFRAGLTRGEGEHQEGAGYTLSYRPIQ